MVYLDERSTPTVSTRVLTTRSSSIRAEHRCVNRHLAAQILRSVARSLVLRLKQRVSCHTMGAVLGGCGLQDAAARPTTCTAVPTGSPGLVRSRSVLTPTCVRTGCAARTDTPRLSPSPSLLPSFPPPSLRVRARACEVDPPFCLATEPSSTYSNQLATLYVAIHFDADSVVIQRFVSGKEPFTHESPVHFIRMSHSE